MAAGIAAALLAAGCGSQSSASASETDGAQQTTTEEPQPVVPTAKARYGSNCSYVLGNFTESASGYRFLADANITNTGNVGIVVRVTGTWAQLGGNPISESKTVRVAYKQGRNVHIHRIVNSDELDLHQGAEGKCHVSATIVRTFGKAHSASEFYYGE